MSCLLFFWLLFVLGNLLKNPSRFVGHLTLLKESDELEQVSGHHLVCICKLKLMHLGLRKEDLFSLLLCHGNLHHSTEVAIIEIADKLYSRLHELVHRHEWASWQYKASRSAGCQHWRTWGRSQGVPQCIRQSLPSYGLHWWDITLQ